MNKKEQIAVLEILIADKDKFVMEIEKINDKRKDELASLKKEAEVKPVFPMGDTSGEAWALITGQVVDISTEFAPFYINAISSLGLVFNTKEEAEKGLERLVARKYVIEAINQANGGRGTFVVFDDNFHFVYNYEAKALRYDNARTLQELHDDFYLRGDCEHLATKLGNNPEFVRNYKTMLGIK